MALTKGGGEMNATAGAWGMMKKEALCMDVKKVGA
jgi:hypothetical protein